jgi:DNA polymerase III delta prime subunit
MDLTAQLKGLNHHAYAIIGSDAVHAELIEILQREHSINSHGNQDFFNRKYRNFTIDDAREVKSIHLMRPVKENDKKIFVLQMDSITVEAQNALLKLLEEPAEYAHFFIIIPSAHLLLPTVKSRMQIIDSSHGGPKVIASEDMLSKAEQFCKSAPAKRLEIIKALMDDITKEKKSKQDAIDFLNAIQSFVYKEKGVKEGRLTLESIETARKYMNDRSPSLKMLHEYAALNI